MKYRVSSYETWKKKKKKQERDSVENNKLLKGWRVK
jgi:hypothetical protein